MVKLNLQKIEKNLQKKLHFDSVNTLKRDPVDTNSYSYEGIGAPNVVAITASRGPARVWEHSKS